MNFADSNICHEFPLLGISGAASNEFRIAYKSGPNYIPAWKIALKQWTAFGA